MFEKKMLSIYLKGQSFQKLFFSKKYLVHDFITKEREWDLTSWENWLGPQGSYKLSAEVSRLNTSQSLRHLRQIHCRHLTVPRKNVKSRSCWHVSAHDLLQQLVVGKAEGLLQQHRQHHAEDEQTFLLRSALLVADLDRDEPNQRGQQQGHEPEKRSEGQTRVVGWWIVTMRWIKVIHSQVDKETILTEESHICLEWIRSY